MATIGDELRRSVERMIRGRPGEELASVLAGDGKLWMVDARDVDWSNPRAPEVDAGLIQDFDHSDLWMRMAASNPDTIGVTGYPMDDGSTVLVFDWRVGTKPVHQPTRIGISVRPHGVDLYVRG